MTASITKFLGEALSVYIITCVVTSSSLFEPIREWIKRKAPFLRVGNHPHLIECRLCFTAYAAALVCLVTGNWLYFLPLYALAYFMATQER